MCGVQEGVVEDDVEFVGASAKGEGGFAGVND